MQYILNFASTINSSLIRVTGISFVFQIETHKLDFKEKAASKIGSLDTSHAGRADNAQVRIKHFLAMTRLY